MSSKLPRRGISAAPPSVPDAAAEAFVRGAPVHVATPSPSPAPEPPTVPASAAAKPGRPRKYQDPPKALTIRVPLETYEDLRYLEYVLRKGSIQEVAGELLTRAAAEARAEEERNQP